MATYARRLLDFGEAWIAHEDFTFVVDARQGFGRRVAIKTQLIDPTCVNVVPAAKRQRVSPAGLALRLEWIDHDTQELLDGDLIGEGLLIRHYETLADARDLAHGRVEEVLRAS